MASERVLLGKGWVTLGMSGLLMVSRRVSTIRENGSERAQPRRLRRSAAAGSNERDLQWLGGDSNSFEVETHVVLGTIVGFGFESMQGAEL
jgi:hypothetical protein